MNVKTEKRVNWVAEVMGCSRDEVLRLIRDGLLQARQHRGSWLVDYDSIVSHMHRQKSAETKRFRRGKLTAL